MPGIEVENPKRFVVVVAASAVLLLILVVWIVKDLGSSPETTSSTSTVTTEPATTEPPGTTEPPATEPTTTTTSTPTAAPAPSLYARPADKPAVTWWKELFRIGTSPDAFTYAAWANPNNSDIDVTKAASLAEAGKRVVIADLTGVGRDQFSAYFAQSPPRDLPIGKLAVHGAAVAADSGIGPGWVRVSVLWSGDVPQPDGTVVNQTKFSEIAFDPTGEWHPVHCKDAPVPDACASYVLPVQG